MVKIKIGDLVQCIEWPKTYDPATRLEVGLEYKVASVSSNGEWIKVVGSDGDYEVNIFILTSSKDLAKTYEVLTKDGHFYHVKCSEEAMKELADLISDDFLASYKLIAEPKKEEVITKAKIKKDKKAS